MRKLFIHFERVPVEVAVKVLKKQNPAAKHTAIRKVAAIKPIARSNRPRSQSKKRGYRTL